MDTQRRDKIIDSWPDLLALAEQYRDGWIFRGEADPRHERLIPKAGRVSAAYGSPRKVPHKATDEVKALKEFRAMAQPYLDHLERPPQSDFEWLALAQHHDVPTRLLDWTENLLVAAYFAVESAGTLGTPEHGCAVIYAVNDLTHVDEKSDNSFHVQHVSVYKPPHVIPRVRAQASVFTIHPQPTESFSHPMLERWVIAHDLELCMQLKQGLSAMNINQSTLFLDIDSVARHVAWLYKWGFSI